MNEISGHRSGRFGNETVDRNATQILRFVLDSVTDCYVAVDEEFTITDLNKAAADWVGSRVEHLLGRNFLDACNKTSVGDRTLLRKWTNMPGGQKVEVASTIHAGRWVEATFLPSKAGCTILFRDISDRRIAQAMSEKAKGLLHSTLDAISSEIAILDERGCVLVANQAWHRFMRRSRGYLHDAGIGEAYIALRNLRPIRPQWQAYRAGIAEVVTGARTEFKLKFRTKVDAGYRSYRLRASSFDVQGWRRIVVVREDVTELEMALHDVDNMASRLVTLQEMERQKYAAELHDSTVQHLTAASLNLMVLRGRMRPNASAAAVISAIEESVAEAQREIRSVSYLLYPRVLDEDGLDATLKRFASGYASRTRIGVTLRTTGALDTLSLSLQRSVLRIVQEAMANVHKHAGASRVWVSVIRCDSRISVSVADDGRGLPGHGKGVAWQPGVGLTGMKARAHQFGGCLKLRSSGRGTLVFARIPCQIDPVD